jgi:hypothetical protein
MSDSVFVFWLDRRSGFLPYWLAFHLKEMVPMFCILMWELFVSGYYQAVRFSVKSLGELGLNSPLLYIIFFLRKKGKAGQYSSSALRAVLVTRLMET